MGIATQTPGGLMVPVVRHAEALDLWQIAAEIVRVSTAARDGTAKKEELSGSTITLSSLGPLGGVNSSPVVNWPEVAILAPNRIVDRPVVIGGAIAVRKMMNLSMSFDHRVVDGYDAALFVQQIKDVLEHPARIFMVLTPKVLVVGGGPGGYVAAIRAGQLGLDCVLVEADRAGGTCLIRGCIPSKALIHAASQFEAMAHASHAPRFGISLSSPPKLDMAETVAWKSTVVDKLNHGVESLLKRAKVTLIHGWARFSDAKTCIVDTADGPLEIKAENVILANGSVAAELPFLPFGGPVISSTEALALDVLPKQLVVVGAGYIGLELGSAFRKFGSAVTVVEAADRILPQYDEPLTKPVRDWLQRSGIELHLSAKAQSLETTAQGHALKVQTADGKTLILPADKILVTVGRKPATQGWGLEAMGLDMSGPFVKVDDQCRTGMKGVFAIGDLVGEPMLAHKASAQGEMVAEIIAGKARRFLPLAIPAVCFTEPEIVSVGLAPADAAASGEDILTSVFPLQASGRALSMDAGGDGGFVRVLARKSDHRLLGVQAVGQHISELVGEFTMAIEMGASLEDIAGVIHAHPTLSEAFHEASLKGLGHAIHV
jgi:dihydrolipoamide dehydrogenase